MKKKDVFCRRATFSDAPQIAQVHVNSWQAAYRALLPADFLATLSVEQRLRMWERLLITESSSFAVFVAGFEGSIVGFVSVGPAREVDSAVNWGEVYAIYVEEQAWGSRIGYELMRAGYNFLKEAEFDVAALWVLAGNEQAIRFYERFGFVRDVSEQGVKLDQLGDVLVRELRYLLNLGQ